MDGLRVDWRTLRHSCVTPTDLPAGGTRSVALRWRCPECGQRWRTSGYSTYWYEEGTPSRRWRKAEARKILAEHKRKIESNDN